MPAAVDQAERTRLYFRYLVEIGGQRRYGPDWHTPERDERIEEELGVIESQGFSATFVMLADVMDMCRRENIPYGPGRGSVGGCYTAYLAGIHDVDSLEFDLLFERFLNKARITQPDVDIDVSQRHRPRVLQYIVDKYSRDDQVVLQIGAFVRAGGRAVVDLVATALAQHDDQAWATATTLKKCFPDSGSITGGQKIQRELHAWLYEEKGHGDKEAFIAIAEQAGWLDLLLKLDGMFTHLGKHAAGVVILRKEDLPLIPKVEVTNSEGVRATVTAYDMYSLDDLGYLKWDFLGLRTLDVVTDAHIFEGGSGNMDDLLDIWRAHRDDPGPYQIFQDADTVGIFQMETDGYRRTLRAFQPTCFDHLVQLVALYRPGAIDYRREEDGKNMVDVFIDRLHGREIVTYDHDLLRPILSPTQGVILYQEQQMAIVRSLGGFTLAQADELRRAIGKKKQSEMDRLMPLFETGCRERGIEEAVIQRIKKNLAAAARYSWNKSHAVEYAIITWWSGWFKHLRVGFYCAEINSWESKKEKQANVIAEARQHVEFSPPDVNIAEDRFIVQDRSIVFGLNGIKGMGDSMRNAILCERMMGGPFASFNGFCQRVGGSVPINMKLALVKCGAFDRLESREHLLALVPKAGKDPDARWTVAEHLNHNLKLKNARPLPADLDAYTFPTDTQLASGEMEAMGYYISATPLANVAKALARHSSNVIGGEVEKVTIKEDRNSNTYGVFTLVTPALTKQSVLMFASNWTTFGNRIEKGAQLLFRGRQDGNKYLADACWAPDDVRHHKRIKVWRDTDKPETNDFDGRIETVRALEQAGYRVRLL
jgi:DNA polymerase-3 subunit alpha